MDHEAPPKFFGLPPFQLTKKMEQGAAATSAVHLLVVDTISKTRTTPHRKDTTWSRIKPIGPMTPTGRWTCDLRPGCFRYTFVLLCPGGGGGSCNTYVIHAGVAGAKFASFPSPRASGDQSGRGVSGRVQHKRPFPIQHERPFPIQHGSSAAGRKKMCSYVAVSSSRCLL